MKTESEGDVSDEPMTAEHFKEMAALWQENADTCSSQTDRVIEGLQCLAQDAWDHAERLQTELNDARLEMEANAETARMAREILLREIRSLKEERERLQSHITLLEGQRTKPGLIGRLLKGRLL